MKVYYLSLREDTPNKDFWDYGIIYDILEGIPSHEVMELPECDSAIVVIPARSHGKLIKEINKELAKVKGVVLFLMGDEEGDFPFEKIKHDNIVFWVQNPQPGRHDDCRRLGTGYPPNIHNSKEEKAPDKGLDWFFAGQITHSRREECAEQLRTMHNGVLLESKGFTQGFPQDEYFSTMARARVAPCPSGPKTPDSFRLFEALEMGCIPIADTQTPDALWEGFWEWLFDEPVPFPVIVNWESLPGYTEDVLNRYPEMNNRVMAWWLRMKVKLQKKLIADAVSVGGEINTSNITVIVPVSPIPSHPDINILEESIKSIRHHLPNSEIIVTFDGVREEQEHLREAYEEHIRRALWFLNSVKNVTPHIFEEHRHQVGMARAIINDINTPLIMYVEQDTPLVTDEPIDWAKVEASVMSGTYNFVRFHFEAVIPKEHESLIIGEPEDGFLKTVQWSQRPHVASTAFYRRFLNENFNSESKCFIEDLMHGKVMESWIRDRKHGWDQWRIAIYYPEGNIKRSYHTDGRDKSNKFDKTQIW